jgi:hypothetical protein
LVEDGADAAVGEEAVDDVGDGGLSAAGEGDLVGELVAGVAEGAAGAPSMRR